MFTVPPSIKRNSKRRKSVKIAENVTYEANERQYTSIKVIRHRLSIDSCT